MVKVNALNNLFFNKFGLNISRYNPNNNPSARRNRILDNYRTDIVIDVGANEGQYAKLLRQNGYQGKIISFEPLSSAFSKLKQESKNDCMWDVYNLALGDVAHKTIINVSQNSYSSSILPMLDSHIASAPKSVYIGKEEVLVDTLDSMLTSYQVDMKNTYLKIDTQGYEEKVLMGAKKTLEFIGIIELEMSLIPLYQGQLLFEDVMSIISKQGYVLSSIEQGFTDQETGQILQVDATFVKG